MFENAKNVLTDINYQQCDLGNLYITPSKNPLTDEMDLGHMFYGFSCIAEDHSDNLKFRAPAIDYEGFVDFTGSVYGTAEYKNAKLCYADGIDLSYKNGFSEQPINGNRPTNVTFYNTTVEKLGIEQVPGYIAALKNKDTITCDQITSDIDLADVWDAVVINSDLDIMSNLVATYTKLLAIGTDYVQSTSTFAPNNVNIYLYTDAEVKQDESILTDLGVTIHRIYTRENN